MVKQGMFISDRYEIIEKAGSGGMADVYKAKCHRLNRYVAIKVLKQEYSSDTKFVSKFRAEAQSVAGLSHPNIVGVYDVGEDEGLHYIVMELVEGITLKTYIEKKGKLEIKEALGIAVQIAQGMEAAHKHKIIHRDIKPQNIIISKEGKVKVTDFGIAKAASSNTITSNAMGSVHYISPEQARGGYSDEKSDIYSLGVTMYEMLNGSVPFSGDNTVAVALAHIQEEMVPLSVLDPKIPNGVDKIVQKCMQKRTDQRYLSASALIEDLKRAIADPDGDFVNISPIMDSNSPTIHIPTDEVKNGKFRVARDANGTENEKDMEEDGALKGKESEIDPKLEKALVIGSIAVAAIICIIIIAIVGNMMGFWGKSGGKTTPEASETPPVTEVPTTSQPLGNDSVELPDLVNHTQEEAVQKLEDLQKSGNVDFDYEIVPEESELIEEGKVIRTDPEALEEVTEGDTVTLYVSSGKKKVAIPNVKNMSVEEAQTELQNLNLRVTNESEYSDDVAINKVVRTKPAIGTEVREGDVVTVVISKGKEKKLVKVPNLLGLKKAKAAKELEKLGLKVGTTDNQYSSKYEPGTVCYQSVKKNQEVEQGTTVDYTVSLGPKPTQPPKQTITYQSSISVTTNPFSGPEETTAKIKWILKQDGNSTEVEHKELNWYSFPYPLVITGSSENDGILEMYKDGELIESITVKFQKVVQ